MEILLRNKVNGTYFKGVNAWTRALAKAFDFQRPERVIRFVRVAHLDPSQMEIVFGFPDPRYNLALPIDDRFEIKPPAQGDRRTQFGVVPETGARLGSPLE